MGLHAEHSIEYSLTCDRCHRKYGSNSDIIEDGHLLKKAARQDGWRTRRDPTISGSLKIWLCPTCARNVALEQGEPGATTSPAEERP